MKRHREAETLREGRRRDGVKITVTLRLNVAQGLRLSDMPKSLT